MSGTRHSMLLVKNEPNGRVWIVKPLGYCWDELRESAVHLAREKGSGVYHLMDEMGITPTSTFAVN